MAISEIQAIQQEFKILQEEAIQQQKKNQLTYKNISVWSQSYYQQKPIPEINKHKFGIYADRQLSHLVIEEAFDFEKIAEILSTQIKNIDYSFQNQPQKFTQTTCRERWYQIHRDFATVSKINSQIKENKRIQSILNMNNPFQNYNIDQLLQKMQKEEITNFNNSYIQQPKHEGYNIFKDSIRRIDNLVQYQQGKKAMIQALQLAKNKVQSQKPMIYTPLYQKCCQFQVKQSQLTLQKMKELMSHPIQMDLISRQLILQQVIPQRFQSKIKTQLQLKELKQKQKKQYENQIQDNWDQYQSD